MVKFEAPVERDLVGWCQARVAGLGARLDDGAARLLVEAIGRDLSGLSGTIERLFLLAGPGGRITVETVESTVVETREQSAFELCDAVSGGEAVRAWALTRKLLGQREPELRLLALLARHYRQLLRLREAREAGKRRDEAGEATKVSPWALKNLWPQTEKHSVASLTRAMALLAETDVLLKSSRIPSGLRSIATASQAEPPPVAATGQIGVRAAAPLVSRPGSA